MLIQSKKVELRDRKVELRSATVQDALEVWKHRKRTSEETVFLSRYPEEYNADTEQIKRELEIMIESPDAFHVTAFLDEHVIGDLGVTPVGSCFKEHHRAYLGISIQQAYCNQGLGSMMMACALQYAKQIGYEQVELGVFSDNNSALHLYEKLGFTRYGIHPRAFRLKDGTYRDEVLMVKIFSNY